MKIRLIMAWLVAGWLGAAAHGGAVDVPLTVSWPDQIRTTVWPVTVGVPMPMGLVGDGHALSVVDDQGSDVACQTMVTARWPDESTRWVRVDFLAHRAAGYRLADGSPAGPTEPVQVEQQGASWTIRTGGATYTFNGHGGCFRRLALKNQPLIDRAGKAWYIVDSKGRRATLVARATDTPITGPVHTVVRVRGEYLTQKEERVAAAVVDYHFHAGLPSVHVSHKLIVTEPTIDLWFKEVGLTLPFTGRRESSGRFVTSTADVPLGIDDTANIAQLTYPHFGSTASRFAVTRTTRNKTATLMQGAVAGDWAALSSVVGTVAVQVPGFAQRFPKAIEANWRELTLKLWAPEAGHDLDFRTKSVIERDLGTDWVPLDHAVAQLENTAQGTAKTHDIWIYPSKGMLRDETRDQFGATEHAIYAHADPKWVAASGVFGPIAAVDRERHPNLEAWIEDYYAREVTIPEQVFPNNGYLFHGRYPYFNQAWEERNGRLYPTIHRLGRCFDYSFKRHVWVLFARSGERNYFEFARKYTRFLGNMMVSNCDAGTKPAGWLVTGPVHTPILWGQFGEAGIRQGDAPKVMQTAQSSLAWQTGDDIIQYVYDWHMTGDLHSRDVAALYKHALLNDTGLDVERVVNEVFPAAIMLKMVASAYELDQDPRVLDFGRRLVERMVDADAPMGLALDVKQHYGGKMDEVLACFFAYWLATGDETALLPIERMAEFDYRHGQFNFLGRSSLRPMAYTLMFERTGETRWARALRSWTNGYGKRVRTVADEGLKAEEIGPTFTGNWGLQTNTASTLIFYGLPAAMHAIAKPGTNDRPVPAAVKPFPTQRTLFALKKAAGHAVTVDLYVHNVGHRAISPKVRGPGGRTAAYEVLERSEIRPEGPTGVPGDYRLYRPFYHMFESHLFLRLRIAANEPAGIYDIDVGEDVAATLLDVDADQVVMIAPDGVVLRQGRMYYFDVPRKTRTLEMFVHRCVEVRDASGNVVELEKDGAAQGVYRAAVGDSYGTWSIRTVRDGRLTGSDVGVDTFVRFLNIPMVLALQDPDRLFAVNARMYPSSEPAGIRQAARQDRPFTPGRFGKGLDLFNRLVALPAAAMSIEKPLPEGTVEFWWRPRWSATDFSIEGDYSTQRLNIFHLGPIGMNWYTDLPNAGRTAYYNHDRLELHLFGVGMTAAMFYPTAGRWYHIAAAWRIDGKQSVMRIFINGRRRSYFRFDNGLNPATRPDALAPTGDRLRFGSNHQYGFCPYGEQMDEVRISRVMRYEDDFEPAARGFQWDDQTVMMMHLDGDLRAQVGPRRTIDAVLIDGERLY